MADMAKSKRGSDRGDRPMTALAAVPDKRSAARLRGAFADEEGMRLERITQDGAEALCLVREQPCDIYVINDILAHMDGFEVLECVRDTYGPEPVVIMLLTGDPQELVSQCFAMGADHVFTRPFDCASLVRRAKTLVGERAQGVYDSSKRRYMETTVLLHRIGMQTNVLGFSAARLAIMHVVEDETLLSRITGQLYPMVAGELGSSPDRVERNIRHAIENAWVNGHMDVINSIFGYSVDASKGKPTNAAFIATLADRIRMLTLRIN